MPERGPRQLVLNGERIEVAVRESPRARSVHLRVGPRRPLEAVVPRGTRDREIDRALRRHRRWIERKTAWAREIASRPPRLGLDRPGLVWLDGAPIPVEHHGRGRPAARLRGDRLLVGGSREAAPAAIGRWYRREARGRLAGAIDRQAGPIGVEPRGLSIRDPRTRWGSCSSSGRLSFSWRLLLTPPEVLDYVVVHELCHLRVLDHSPAFWRLLDQARPGWRCQAGWLEEHALELGDYAPRLPGG